jgi:hypothetical protein
MFWYEKYEKHVVLSVRQGVTEYICANPNKLIFGPCSYFLFRVSEIRPLAEGSHFADLNHECDVHNDQHLETKCYKSKGCRIIILFVLSGNWKTLCYLIKKNSAIYFSNCQILCKQ